MKVIRALVLSYCNSGGSDGNGIGDDSLWLVKMSVVIMMVIVLMVVHGSGGILGFHMM